MEALLFSSSADHHQPQIIRSKSHIKNTPKRGTNRPPLIARQVSENFAPSNLHKTTGLLQAAHPNFPPPYHLSLSYPPFSSQQPPLLPLPIPINNSLVRGLSCPPTRRNTNKNNTFRSTPTRNSSLTPKKTKSISKKDVNLKPFGPDPKDLPKNGPRTLLPGNNNSTDEAVKDDEAVGGFSGSVAFTISPPPSSLPLPTFSLRPKLSCNAEAAGVDAGATDNLRRLLRLV